MSCCSGTDYWITAQASGHGHQSCLDPLLGSTPLSGTDSSCPVGERLRGHWAGPLPSQDMKPSLPCSHGTLTFYNTAHVGVHVQDLLSSALDLQELRVYLPPPLPWPGEAWSKGQVLQLVLAHGGRKFPWAQAGTLRSSHLHWTCKWAGIRVLDRVTKGKTQLAKGRARQSLFAGARMGTEQPWLRNPIWPLTAKPFRVPTHMTL